MTSSFVSMGKANQQRRSVIALHCKPSFGDARDNQTLCQALEQVLAEMAPKHVIRLNPVQDIPDVLSVTLELDEAGPDNLSGALAWRKGDRTSQTGPRLKIALTKTHLPATHAQRFARDLVRSSRGLKALLLLPRND